MTEIDVVTGAFGYTGAYLTHNLQAAGHHVRSLTNHPKPSTTIEAHPYTFNDRNALVRVFTGATTFYNTYWVRYVHGGTTYDQAVRNTQILIEAASKTGVERIVHISITKPSHDSFYEYYRGKAAIEDTPSGRKRSPSTTWWAPSHAASGPGTCRYTCRRHWSPSCYGSSPR